MKPRLALLYAAAALAAIRTGPEPGAPAPPVEAVDQTGRLRTLAGIAGPRGVLLVFYRSADW